MPVYLAHKTMAAIEEALQRDQGASYRQLLQRILPTLTDAYRGEEDGFRSHLGASVVGDKCPRKVWYGYRAVKIPKFEGRMVRLFNRGHLEEGRFMALIEMIGIKIRLLDKDGHQVRFSAFEGHYGGSSDGFGTGFPDIKQDEEALIECKTHNEKSFLKLKKDGVIESKPEHYTQMCIYMHHFNLQCGFYFATNKNNDELYVEIVPANPDHAKFYNERAGDIIAARVPPLRISKSPSFFECSWCDFKALCHKQKNVDYGIHRGCRTCEHSQPAAEGLWLCNKYNYVLTKENQIAGCTSHELIKEI